MIKSKLNCFWMVLKKLEPEMKFTQNFINFLYCVTVKAKPYSYLRVEKKIKNAIFRNLHWKHENRIFNFIFFFHLNSKYL